MPSPPLPPLDRIMAQLDAFEADGGEGFLHLDDRTILPVSNLNKVFFPKDDITKGDLMRYYVWMASYVLPRLEDRPLSLRRFPEGIAHDFFYQQKAPARPPRGVRVESIRSEAGKSQERLIGGTLATLLYCVQLGAFECNPWNARVQSLEFPDYTVIDLDPGPKVPFDGVVETALWVKEALDAFGLYASVKTSGVSGMHIIIPLPRDTDEGTAELVGNHVASAVAKAHPKYATIERSLKGRKSTQVYVDAGQNARGKTVASPYSVRAAPGALVSTPLAWEELTPKFDPTQFTILTLPDRVEVVGDLWGL